jgi:hypothetical protein
MNGLLDLVDGCPEMLAEGLAEMHDDISANEWEQRFQNSLRWLRRYFYRLWLNHYDVTVSEVKEMIEEHDLDTQDDGPDTESLPEPANEKCSCGASLPDESPSVITRWQEATKATAVCFECFGQIQNRIAVSE